MMTYSRAKVILRRNIEAFHMQTVKLKVKDRLQAVINYDADNKQFLK